MRILAASLILSCASVAAHAEPGSVLSSQGQRFVYGQVSAYARHQYMLDTQTGRLWQIICIKSGEKAAGASASEASCVQFGLEPIAYTDTNGNPITFMPAQTPGKN